MRKRWLLLVALIGLCMFAAGPVFANTNERVNLDYLGNELTGFTQGFATWFSDISADGRYVLYNSYQSSIVPNDTNNNWDVFIRDRETGEIELVSVDNNGQQFQEVSYSPDMSDDGRYVVFENKESADWRATNNFDYIYVRDRVAGTTKLVSVKLGIWGNGGYVNPMISDNGKVVVYQAYRNLTSGTRTIVYDLETDTADFLPVNGYATAISGNGRYVAVSVNEGYITYRLYVCDRETGQVFLASKNHDGTESALLYTNVDMSYDGRYTVFRDKQYVWDADAQIGGSMYVVYDLETDTTTPVVFRDDGTPSGHYATIGTAIAISADGSTIAFISSDPTLFPEGSGITHYGQTYQIFVADRESKKLLDLVSYGYDGELANSMPNLTTVSADGQYVLFESAATNIVPDDTNGVKDVFLVDRGPQNAPPVADAGDDQSVECAGTSGSLVTLDGSGSSDPDGDALTYTWSGPFGTQTGETAAVTLPLGTHTITLTVDDGNGGTATDDVVITVEDTTPPVITYATLSGNELLSGLYLSDVVFEMEATDTCSGVAHVRYTLDGTQTIVSGSYASDTISDGGNHTIVYDAEDNAANLSEEGSLSFSLFEANASGLIDLIDYFLANGLIQPQMETSLKQQVTNGAYGAFINHVEAQSGKKIDPIAAGVLTQAAQYIMGN